MADELSNLVENPDPGVGDGPPVRIAFECPRCGSEVAAAFYGPCDGCRSDLRATVTADAEDVAAAEYEPKMNVTPNAVALKE